jgi:probable F420-dependent oxidoreductase
LIERVMPRAGARRRQEPVIVQEEPVIVQERGMRVKVGLIPAQDGEVQSSGGYIAEFVHTAESAGFESIWLGEHPALPVDPGTPYPGSREGLREPSSKPLPDPLEWIAFAAGHSENMVFGTAVVILPLHPPVVLAKRVATLDCVTGGRFRLGIGVGWNREEFEACGAPWARRGARAEEAIEAMRALWRNEQAGYAGELIRFEPLYSAPKPVTGSVPVLVGGSSDAGARRAGRLGDGYLPFDRSYDSLARRVEMMRGAAVEAGRDPDAVEITALGSTRPDKIKQLEWLGVRRMLLFAADIAALPALGRRVMDAASPSP